jgi:hypothetical protein
LCSFVPPFSFSMRRRAGKFLLLISFRLWPLSPFLISSHQRQSRQPFSATFTMASLTLLLDCLGAAAAACTIYEPTTLPQSPLSLSLSFSLSLSLSLSFSLSPTLSFSFSLSLSLSLSVLGPPPPAAFKTPAHVARPPANLQQHCPTQETHFVLFYSRL